MGLPGDQNKDWDIRWMRGHKIRVGSGSVLGEGHSGHVMSAVWSQQRYLGRHGVGEWGGGDRIIFQILGNHLEDD